MMHSEGQLRVYQLQSRRRAYRGLSCASVATGDGQEERERERERERETTKEETQSPGILGAGLCKILGRGQRKEALLAPDHAYNLHTLCVSSSQTEPGLAASDRGVWQDRAHGLAGESPEAESAAMGRHCIVDCRASLLIGDKPRALCNGGFLCREAWCPVGWCERGWASQLVELESWIMFFMLAFPSVNGIWFDCRFALTTRNRDRRWI
ncbi:hypothetical protein J3F83DRAFT_682135 [Trichoderma novae-zelandiae]